MTWKASIHFVFVFLDHSRQPTVSSIPVDFYTPWSTDVAMESIADTQALEYLALYSQEKFFNEPADFITLRRSNSDLARLAKVMHVILNPSLFFF